MGNLVQQLQKAVVLMLDNTAVTLTGEALDHATAEIREWKSIADNAIITGDCEWRIMRIENADLSIYCEEIDCIIYDVCVDDIAELQTDNLSAVYQHPEFETDLSMCKFNNDEYEYDVDENLQLTIYLDAQSGDIETQYYYENRKQIDHDLKLATEQYGITFKQYGKDITE